MKVSVVGCGLIGASWAALFAACGGHEVWAWDPVESARAGFPGKVAAARHQLLALGAPDVGSVHTGESIEQALDGSIWVQECVPEDVTVKAPLYRQMESVLTLDAMIASSTSSFTWSQLAASLEHSTRFVIAHPFNPPHLIPLVELYSPDADTLSRAERFFRALGREPVCLKREATGHIGNRLASALWREAVNIVAEGIADVADVDKVLIHGPGLRWSVVGTHMGYHLGGGNGGIEHYLQHLGPSQERRWASLGNPTLTPELCDLIAQGVHSAAAGRTIAQLEAERDQQLIAVLRTRRLHPTIDTSNNSSREEI